MREVIQLVIDHGGYDLSEVLMKIEREWVLGHITEGDRDQLVDSARAHATPEGSLGPVAQRVTSVETSIRDLLARVDALEGKRPPVGKEYPDYVAGKSYYNGDGITYIGRRYKCVYAEGLPCVWSPDEYPAGWSLVG